MLLLGNLEANLDRFHIVWYGATLFAIDALMFVIIRCSTEEPPAGFQSSFSSTVKFCNYHSCQPLKPHQSITIHPRQYIIYVWVMHFKNLAYRHISSRTLPVFHPAKCTK